MKIQNSDGEIRAQGSWADYEILTPYNTMVDIETGGAGVAVSRSITIEESNKIYDSEEGENFRSGLMWGSLSLTHLVEKYGFKVFKEPNRYTRKDYDPAFQ